MRQRPSNWHLGFLLMLFFILAVGSFFWTRQVRSGYVHPEVEIENKVPDPFGAENPRAATPRK